MKQFKLLLCGFTKIFCDLTLVSNLEKNIIHQCRIDLHAVDNHFVDYQLKLLYKLFYMPWWDSIAMGCTCFIWFDILGIVFLASIFSSWGVKFEHTPENSSCECVYERNISTSCLALLSDFSSTCRLILVGWIKSYDVCAIVLCWLAIGCICRALALPLFHVFFWPLYWYWNNFNWWWIHFTG